MFEESSLNSIIRWHLYRRWRRPPRQVRVCEYLFHRSLRAMPQGVMVDCGANVGEVVAAARQHGVDVVAFEPDPVALQHLQRRFAADPSVTIHDAAVGARDGEAAFYQEPEVDDGQIGNTIGSSLFQMARHKAEPVAIVKVVDLVRFIGQLGRPVSLLKLDVEGAEIDIVEALLDTQAYRSIGFVVVETHERFSVELAARTQALRDRLAREGVKNINLDWV